LLDDFSIQRKISHSMGSLFFKIQISVNLVCLYAFKLIIISDLILES